MKTQKMIEALEQDKGKYRYIKGALSNPPGCGRCTLGLLLSHAGWDGGAWDVVPDQPMNFRNTLFTEYGLRSEDVAAIARNNDELWNSFDDAIKWLKT